MIIDLETTILYLFSVRIFKGNLTPNKLCHECYCKKYLGTLSSTLIKNNKTFRERDVVFLSKVRIACDKIWITETLPTITTYHNLTLHSCSALTTVCLSGLPYFLHDTWIHGNFLLQVVYIVGFLAVLNMVCMF